MCTEEKKKKKKKTMCTKHNVDCVRRFSMRLLSNNFAFYIFLLCLMTLFTHQLSIEKHSNKKQMLGLTALFKI